MIDTTAAQRNLPRFLRILHVRWRLAVALLLLVTVFAVLQFTVLRSWLIGPIPGLPPVTLASELVPYARNFLIAWDVGVAFYLAAGYWAMAHCTAHHIRQQAAREDEGKFTILGIIVGASLIALTAIVVELGTEKPTAFALALAIVTIMLSWAFIHTIFALHYAHEYFGEGDDGRERGLKFPGDEEPDYWDFIYFAFGIGMTFQVADVAITSKLIRRLAVVHGIVSFVFNVALLALTVNIAAPAIFGNKQ
jgi:uncharacterized membrane protein